MPDVPVHRRLAAGLLIPAWNIADTLTYALKQRQERARFLRQFCRENDITLSGRVLSQSHRCFRRFKRANTALIVGVMLDDLTGLDRLHRELTIRGRDLLEHYRDKGAILVGFHIGPFTMIPPLLARMNYNVAILARADEFDAATGRSIDDVNGIIADRLSRHGCGTARFIDSQNMLALIQVKKALNRKEFLMVYPDTARSSSVAWAPLPFFRQTLAGHLGLAKLVQMTQADILYLVTYWDDRGRMILEVTGPQTYTKGASAEEILRQIYRPFEDLVSRYLPQWIQVHSYDELKYELPPREPSSLPSKQIGQP